MTGLRGNLKFASIHSNHTLPSNNATFWIGGYYQTAEKSFAWIDGTAWDYSNWKTGEPGNTGGNEHFVGIDSNHEWDDLPGSDTLFCLWIKP